MWPARAADRRPPTADRRRPGPPPRRAAFPEEGTPSSVLPPPSSPPGAAAGRTEAGEAAGQTFTVRVEGLSWVNTFLGGPGTGLYGHDLPAQAGDTVRDVLLRASERFPALKAALWDRGTTELGEHLEVIVNGSVLGLHHRLESPVAPGDKILLLGQYQGG